MKLFTKYLQISINPYFILLLLTISVQMSWAQVPATLPYSTGFESTTLDAAWSTTTSLTTGEIKTFTAITAACVPHSGSYFMGMHHLAAGSGAYNINEAKLHLDLSASGGQVDMEFWFAEWNDEQEPEDGIYLSDNGGLSYMKMLDLYGPNFTDLQWYHFNIDLDSAATSLGLSLNSNFVIKFQQHDNYYFNGGNDGHMYDDILITSPIPPVANNASVSAIVDPVAGCVGTHDVNVGIANNGTNQISSLSVNWSVNGIFQGTVPYTQLLDTSNGIGPNKDTITLGQVSFVNSGNYEIKAWTINPNSVLDAFNFDDTSTISLTGVNYPSSTLGADTSICPDQPLNLVASSSSPDSVRWNDNSNGNSRVISMSGIYKVDIYKNLCKTQDSINVSMHPTAPSVDLGNDTTFCYGDIFTLDATTSGVTYIWQDNSTNPTFSTDTLGDYWVTIEDANSCRSSDSIELKLYKDPSISLFVSPSTIVCFGSTLIFQANGKTEGSEMYQLVINGINVGSPQSGKIFTNPVVEHGDTVRVDLITDQCASAPYPVSSNSFGMTVNPESVLISGLIADTVIENTKKSYAVSAASGSSYLWQVTGGTIVGDSTTFAVQVQWNGPNPNASLTLIETTSSNCSRPNVLPVNVISIDGLNDYGLDFLGIAYPNPADNSLTIPVNSSQSLKINLGIYDLSGKEVKNIYNGELNGKRNFELQVGSLDEGMYFYKLTRSDGNQITRKLLIKH